MITEPELQDKLLPDHLSDLVELANTEFKDCLESGDYRVNWLSWHKPKKGTCEICLGGALVARTWGYPPNVLWNPDLKLRSNTKLFAVNAARVGAIGLAYTWLGQRPAQGDYWNIPTSMKPGGSEEFYEETGELVDYLRSYERSLLDTQ